MDHAIFVCCCRGCLEKHYNDLIRIVYKVPKVIVRHTSRTIKDDKIAIVFIIDQTDMYRFHGLNIVKVFTCGKCRNEDTLQHCRMLLKRSKEPASIRRRFR